MKIVHLTYTMTYGGIETMLVNIANVQAKTNQVYLVTINDKNEPSLLQTLKSDVSFMNVGRPLGSKNPWYILKLNMLLRRISPDIIHVHHPGIVRFLMPKMYHNSRVVFTMHDIPVKDDLNYIYKYKTVFAISQSVKDSLTKIGISSEVVLNGIMTSKFKRKEMYQSTPPLLRHTG